MKQRERVIERRARGHEVSIYLEGGPVVNLRRFAPVGPGDILVRTCGSCGVWLEKHNDIVKIEPAWMTDFGLDVGDGLPIRIKEIETKEEMDGFERLTKFHYRGSGGAGRRLPLVAVVNDWRLPHVVGMIELSSSFIVNSARTRILNAPFCDSRLGIAWARWDSATARKYGSSLARISRCVVYPELRGIGLTRLLVNAAVSFAADRWHLGGMRPAFIEITAEMLRYWPFVRRSEFVFIGDTEGNRHRAAADMRYLLSRKQGRDGMPRGGGGILSAQRSYATSLEQAIRGRELTAGGVVQLLQRPADSLSDDEWIALHKVYRRPKPTYMRGLTPDAEAFLERRVGLNAGTPEAKRGCPRAKKRGTRPEIVIQDLSIQGKARAEASLRARRVQEAFGIVSKEVETLVIAPFDLRFRPGTLTMIAGPSGSGKSLLLKAISALAGRGRRQRLPSGIDVSGQIEGERVRVAWPRAVQASRSPIELLANKTVDEALSLLAQGGLAEADLFVRPAKTLSVGQAYRLRLALALSEDPDVLLVDEFCEPLDKFNALAVSRRLRVVTTEASLVTVVATADPDRILSTLLPDQVVRLSSDGAVTVLDSWREGLA